LKTRRGKFELADSGTLLLDEIGEMPLAAQSKLLRVLQERTVVRIGGDDEIKVDVRIICTTNRDLKKEVENGNFREDLYYRLSVVPVHIPPLRERTDDIPDLLNYFIGKFNEENGRAVEEASEETVSMLQEQMWPGNIRQLENAIARAMVFCKGTTLTPEFFEIEGGKNVSAGKTKKKA